MMRERWKQERTQKQLSVIMMWETATYYWMFLYCMIWRLDLLHMKWPDHSAVTLNICILLPCFLGFINPTKIFVFHSKAEGKYRWKPVFFPWKQNYSFPVEWCCSMTLNHTTRFVINTATLMTDPIKASTRTLDQNPKSKLFNHLRGIKKFGY